MHHYIEDIAQQFKSHVSDNVIEIPASLGKGFIKSLFIESEFCLIYFNYTLNEDRVFKLLYDHGSNNALFKLIFNLDLLQNDELDSAGETIHPFETTGSSILYSTDFARTSIIKKGTPVNRIAIVFSKDWLEENFNEASDKIFSIVNILIKKNKPTFIAEEMDHSHYVFASELAEEMTRTKFPLIHIKTKALILLNNFLDKIVSRGDYSINSNQTLYYHEITKVERKLRDYFDKPLPGIANLAIEFNMSAATLKRNFKIVYGKSIYNYYLEKKLEIGRSLIASKTRSISEIAYSLGYNKTNSFSKAFKKQYGILPKEVNVVQAMV